MGRTKNKEKVKPKVMHGIKGDNLTIKQRKFVKNLAITGNATEATKRAYNTTTDTSAGAIGSKLLKKDKIQKALAVELENAGLTDSKIFAAMDEAMTSGLGRDSRNSDAIRVMDMYHKIKGNYAPKQIEKKELNLTLNTKEDAELIDMMKDQVERLKKMTGEE